MVTNNAGSVNDASQNSKVKENGNLDNNKDSKNEYSNVKSNQEETMKNNAGGAPDKSARAEHDIANKMSTPGEKQSFGHVPVSNGFPPSTSYNNLGNGGGLAHPPASVNGPQPNGPYPGYGSYPHAPQKQGGSRPMHGISPAYMPGQRYPSGIHNSGNPQSLGQLLQGPTRFPSQYPNYSTHGSTGQADYSQSSQQAWSSLPPQYARPGDQTDSYNQQQQQQHYSSQQVRYLTHHNLPRYPAAPPSTVSSYQPHQVQHGSVAYPPDSRTPAGYPPASGYAGYPSHNHMQAQQPPPPHHPPYYPIRQPTQAPNQQQHPYPTAEQNSTPSQPLPPEASGSSAAGAHQSSRPNSTSSVAASSSSAAAQQSDRERMMSPNRKPQTPSTSQPNAATDHQSPGPAPPTPSSAAAAGPSSSSAASTSGPPSVGGSSGGAVASPQPFPRHHMRPNASTPGSDTVNSPAPPTPGASTSSQQPSTPAPATPLPATPSSQARAQPSPSVQTSSAVQQLTSMVRPAMDGAALPSISNAVSMPGYGSPYNRPGYQMHPTNYPQHVSPHQQGQMQQQQQQMYGNQSHPGTPRPTQNVIPNRPPAPVAGSGGKPHQINNYNSQPHTPQSAYSPAPQAYNTASPAPAPERRLSKQGPTASAGNSSASGVAATPGGVPQSPDTQSNRQGAAQAAAAAAVVAAAHTALTNSQGAAAAAAPPGAPVKPPAAGYYPGQPPTPVPPQQTGPPVPPSPQQQQQQQQQAGPPPPQQTPQQVAPPPQHQQRVMTRPNYGPMQPGAEGAPPSAYQPGMHPYSRMPHPNMPPTTAGGMPRMPGHPGMSNSPGVRMQPSGNMYNHGYSNQHPSQPGPYPGYYPPGGTPEHHPRLPSYPTQMNAYSAPPRTPAQDETKKAPQARSASQKLAALYEPSDEPGRRDFIDRVLKYWEDKNLPLKNAPLMGRKTLDLFLLYRLVKERNFMVEVTNQKKWNEISTLMKLNSSNTSGFTLKKQYCKYLYGFECRFERGEEEPQEALSRITEANRKKKNQADQQNQHNSSMKATVDDLKNNSAVSSVSRLPAPRMPAYTPYSRYPGTPQPPPNSLGYVPPQQHYAHPNMNNSMSPKPQMYPSQPLPSYPVHGQPTSYPGAPPNQAPGSSAAPGSYPPHAAAQGIVPPPQQQQQGGPPPPSMNSDKSVAGGASAGNSSHNTSVDGMSQASSSSTSVSLPHSASAGGSSKQQPKPMQGADNTNSNDSSASAASSAVPPSPAHAPKSAPGSSTAAPVATTGSDATNANDQQNSSAVAPTATTGEIGKEVTSAAPASHPSQSSMAKAHHQQQQAQYKMPLPPPSVHPAGAPGAPGTPVSGGHMPYQQRPTHDPTHPYPNRPYPTSHQMPPPSPFYPGQSTPQRQHPVHPGSVPGYHHPPDMRRSPYQGHGYPARPQYPHQQPGYPVPPQQGPSSGPPNQANLKRPGQDISGQPPNKYPRPEGMAGYYQQSHMMPRHMMPRHHPPYTQSPVSSVPPSSMGMPPHQQPPGTSVMSRGPGPSYHPSSRGSPNVPAGMYQDRFRQRMRWRPPMQTQLRQPERRQPDKMMPNRIAMYAGRRNQPLFPPGSVEATEPKIVKFHRKTCRDVGSLEAWRVIMSLKSGLLVESTWALNVLTILLYDNQTVHQFKLAQLPGLLDSLVDHYRKYLAEFFTLPSEREALGVTNCDPNNWSKDEAAASSAAKDEQQHKQLSNGEKMELDDASLTGAAASSSNNNSSGHDSSSGDVPKSKNKGGRKKRVGACQSASMNSKLSGHHTKLPVKVEHAVNPFVVDKSDLWDRVNKLNATDDLSHIVVSFLQEKIKNEIDDLPDDEDTDGSSEISGTTTTPSTTNEKKVKIEVDDPVVAVEATLEDVLSIPSSIDVDMEEDTSSSSSSATSEQPSPTTSSPTPNGPHRPASSSDDAKLTATIKSEPKEAAATPATTDNAVAAASTDGDKANGSSDKAANGEKEADDANNKKNEKKQNNKTADKPAVVSSRSSSRRSSRNSTKSRSNSRNSSSDTAPANTVEKKESAPAEAATATSPAPTVVKKATPAETTTTEAVETKSKDNSDADVTATVPTQVATAVKKLVKAKSKIERVLEQSNVVLLESEAIGDEGCTRENWAGASLAKSSRRHKQEIALRLMCVCNIIRSLSFLHANSQEIFRHRPLMRAISGVMLIRHKHRTLSSRAGISFEEASRGKRESGEDSYQLFNTRDDQPINEYSWFAPKKRQQKQQQEMMEVDETSSSSPFATPSSTTCCSTPSKRSPRRIYSSTVLDENEDTSDVYKDTWWWNHVRRMREDAMVILCNITPCVDLSELPDDHTALAMLEACLHWSTCPSSEASDPFNSDSHSNSAISPQNISLEILTKLSLRDQNVDLMLATRPYSRIEKLFSNLINLISDRKDLALREFSFVLLSNLAAGDVVAARAIAIQKSSINTLISFLEECELTGQHNSNLFTSQQQTTLQCGTTPFMMLKCAKILLSLAKVAENRSSFIRYTCRLMDLSMSKVLREEVVKVMSSILYEASAVDEVETMT